MNIPTPQPEPYDLDAILAANHLSIPIEQRSVLVPMTSGSLISLCTDARRLDVQLVQAICDRSDAFGKAGSRAILADGLDGDLMFAAFQLRSALEEVGPKQSDILRFTQFHCNTAYTGLLETGLPAAEAAVETAEKAEAYQARAFVLDVKDDLIENVIAKMNGATDSPYKIELDAALKGRAVNKRFMSMNDYTALVKQVANEIGAKRVKGANGTWKLVAPETPAGPDGF